MEGEKRVGEMERGEMGDRQTQGERQTKKDK